MAMNKIYEWARIQPEKPALIYNNVVLDYAFFARSIELARKFLERFNLPKDATAIVQVKNLFDAWRITFALRTLGLNTIAVASIAQAKDLQIRGAACIVMTDLGYQFYRPSENALAGIKIIVVPRVADADVQRADLPEISGNDRPFGGHILYTSGTTGDYKKLKLDGASEERRNSARARAYSLNKGTIYQGNDIGLWTQIGFRMPCAVWNEGGCVVFNQPIGGHQQTANAVQFFRHGVNFSLILPWILSDLVQSVDTSDQPHNDCRLFVTTGFLPSALAEKASHKITNDINVSYGSTELGTPAMASHYEDKDSLYWLTPPNERTIQIVDEGGNQCPMGKEGELRVLTEDTDCKSYLDDEDASARVFRDGFFYPGDMAIKRADGRIRVLGRVSDVINIRGDKFAVGPIEQSVSDLLQVDETCLFVHLNDAGQEELIVAIQSDKKPPQEKLDHIPREFPSFERIRIAVFKEFPRTDTGTRKVRRADLKSLILGESTNGVPQFVMVAVE
jgi:acyl-coenzyme A synthetase/AMP-(fatty) acid ligase